MVLMMVSIVGYGQQWVPLGIPKTLNYDGRVLYTDTVLDKLWVGGDFTAVNGHRAYGIANWNGTDWDTLNGGFDLIGSSVIAIARYNSDLYVGGGFYLSNGHNVNNFAKWNGAYWDSTNIPFARWQSSNDPYYFYVANNLLYCVGAMDTVGGNFCTDIVAFDGVNWIPFEIPHFNTGYWIETCAMFQNEMYFGGWFWDSTGVFHNFVKFDGANWYDVDSSFTGGVHSMVVYNNELYLGGAGFTNVPGKCIVKYDGTHFTTLNGDIDQVIRRLRVFGDKLFAVGYIDSAGGVPVYSNVAMYDGNHWTPISNDTINALGDLWDVAVFHNEIYVTGSFRTINSDTVWNIAKYQGWYLGENDLKKDNTAISLFPNPNNGTFTLHSPLGIKNYELRIVDVYGRTVYSQAFTTTKENETITLPLSSGIYFWQLLTNEAVAAKGKLVVIK